jgi:hypothetical protein
MFLNTNLIFFEVRFFFWENWLTVQKLLWSEWKDDWKEDHTIDNHFHGVKFYLGLRGKIFLCSWVRGGTRETAHWPHTIPHICSPFPVLVRVSPLPNKFKCHYFFFSMMECRVWGLDKTRFHLNRSSTMLHLYGRGEKPITMCRNRTESQGMPKVRATMSHVHIFSCTHTPERRRDPRTHVIFWVRHTTIVTEVLRTLKHMTG